jgi:hypothetical protein
MNNSDISCLTTFMWLLVIGTSFWVFFDAKTIGIKKGQVKGVADMGPGGWFLACLLLWIISFPLSFGFCGERSLRDRPTCSFPKDTGTGVPVVAIFELAGRLLQYPKACMIYPNAGMIYPKAGIIYPNAGMISLGNAPSQ